MSRLNHSAITIRRHQTCDPSPASDATSWRWTGTGVTCNAVHPGLCKTELGRHMSFYNSWLAAVVVKPMQWFVLRSPAQGAACVVYAAAEPSLADTSGEYIRWALRAAVPAP